MDSIREFLGTQLANNQFMSGGVVLMVIGALGAYLRNLPGQIRRWCSSRLFLEFEIPDTDPAFEWFEAWLAEQNYAQHKAKRLRVLTRREVKDRHREIEPAVSGGPSPRRRILFSPADGIHILFHKGKLVWLNRYKEKGGSTSGDRSQIERSVFTVHILSKDRSVMRSLLEEAYAMADPPEEQGMCISYYTEYFGWRESNKQQIRPLHSVILAAGVMETILADIDKFAKSKDVYVSRGIPHQLGFLLYGEPGTGKSSTVMAVAAHFGMEISILSLSGSGVDDDAIRTRIGSLPPNSILLLEDVDCIFNDRSTVKTDAKLTFSGLLNALDGVIQTPGRIVFMTTNHRDKLDKALIRPGRVDRQLYIGLADHDQLRRIFLKFYPDKHQLVEHFVDSVGDEKLPLATVQGHLLRHDDPEQAVAAVPQWLVEVKEQQRKAIEDASVLVGSVGSSHENLPDNGRDKS